MSTILTLRQRILEQKEWFDRKCVAAIRQSTLQGAKLRGDWQTSGMKVTELNARLKGENAYLEEERMLLQSHIDFLEGSIGTLDHQYYHFRNKMTFDERYSNRDNV